MPGSKVSIIGAGNVGATAAYYVAEKVIADIVMVDIAEVEKEVGPMAI